MKIGLVVAEFNREITEKMERAAEEHAKKMGHSISHKFFIFGSLDSPIAAQHLLKQNDVDAVVLLGAVVTGDTDHDVVVVRVAEMGVVELTLKYNKPIGWGISGPKQTWEQANVRAEEYARRAVEAVDKIYKQIT